MNSLNLFRFGFRNTILLAALLPSQSFAQSDKVKIPPMPPYANHSGICDLRFSVDEAGVPYDVNVISCNDTGFADTAKKSVEKWQYNPKIENGIPVVREGVETTIKFQFVDVEGKPVPFAKHVSRVIKPDDVDAAVLDKSAIVAPSSISPLEEDKGYCCFQYGISQVGFPMNIETQSCSEEKFVIPARYTLIDLKYVPVQNNEGPISTAGYAAVIRYAKLSRSLRKKYPRDKSKYTPILGSDDDFAYYCEAEK